MILQIAAGGRTRAVEVSRQGDRFVVAIDGRPHEVDVKVINEVMSLLIRPPEGGPDKPDVASSFRRTYRSYEVSVAVSASGTTTFHVDGFPVEVSVEQSRPSWASQGRGPAAHAEGPQTITAPMPGKIVKLLVKAGDRVASRQGVVVVEAMKMENELRARAAGTVSEVRVAEGSSVEAGAILVILT